jgi:hypothetical protein
MKQRSVHSAPASITGLTDTTDGGTELDLLRREQAAAVMPLIGPLLDAWDGMPNDEKDPDSTLFRVMEKIAAAMEGS